MRGQLRVARGALWSGQSKAAAWSTTGKIAEGHCREDHPPADNISCRAWKWKDLASLQMHLCGLVSVAVIQKAEATTEILERAWIGTNKEMV